MNTDFVIYALSIFMLFVGWLIAYVTYRRKLVKLTHWSHQEQYEEHQRGYKLGWDDGVYSIMSDPEELRARCNEYYHTHNP